MMTGRLLATLMGALVLAAPAGAQIGTPGVGPLTPDGPRRGLGPPSVTDSVPDLRLRAPGNGIPGAGPPVGAYQPSPPLRLEGTRPLRGKVERARCRPVTGKAQSRRCRR